MFKLFVTFFEQKTILMKFIINSIIFFFLTNLISNFRNFLFFLLVLEEENSWLSIEREGKGERYVVGRERGR